MTENVYDEYGQRQVLRAENKKEKIAATCRSWAYVLFILSLAYVICFWLVPFPMDFILIMGFPLIGLASLAAIVLTILSFRHSAMLDRLLLPILAVLVPLVFFWGGNVSPHTTSARRMERHYERNRQEFDDLVSFAHTAFPDSMDVWIQYEHGKLWRFRVVVGDGDGVVGNESVPVVAFTEDDEPEDYEPVAKSPGYEVLHLDDVGQDSLMHLVGISADELEQLHTLLDRAGLIGIELERGSASVELLYKYVGLGLYSYLIDSGMDSADYACLRDDISHIAYNDSVFFKYEPGAVGSFIFGGKEEYLRGLERRRAKSK